MKFGQNGENVYALRSAFIFQWQGGGHFDQVLPKAPGSKPAHPRQAVLDGLTPMDTGARSLGRAVDR